MKKKNLIIVMAVVMGLVTYSGSTITLASDYSIWGNQDEYLYEDEDSDEYWDEDEDSDEYWDEDEDSDETLDEDDIWRLFGIGNEDEIEFLNEVLKQDKKTKKNISDVWGIMCNAFDEDEWGVKEKGVLSKEYAITDEDYPDYYYEGQLKKNKPDGDGILENGSSGLDIYIGEFSKGKYDGLGMECICETPSEYEVYIGEYKDGKKNGYGFHTLGNSYYAVGDFKKDKLDGTASVYMDGILRYEGELRKGKASGKGKSYYESGKLMYEGEFKNGDFNGKGTKYDEDGNEVYSGKWKDGDYAS